MWHAPIGRCCRVALRARTNQAPSAQTHARVNWNPSLLHPSPRLKRAPCSAALPRTAAGVPHEPIASLLEPLIVLSGPAGLPPAVLGTIWPSWPPRNLQRLRLRPRRAEHPTATACTAAVTAVAAERQRYAPPRATCPPETRSVRRQAANRRPSSAVHRSQYVFSLRPGYLPTRPSTPSPSQPPTRPLC